MLTRSLAGSIKGTSGEDSSIGVTLLSDIRFVFDERKTERSHRRSWLNVSVRLKAGRGLSGPTEGHDCK